MEVILFLALAHVCIHYLYPFSFCCARHGFLFCFDSISSLSCHIQSHETKNSKLVRNNRTLTRKQEAGEITEHHLFIISSTGFVLGAGTRICEDYKILDNTH